MSFKIFHRFIEALVFTCFLDRSEACSDALAETVIVYKNASSESSKPLFPSFLCCRFVRKKLNQQDLIVLAVDNRSNYHVAIFVLFAHEFRLLLKSLCEQPCGFMLTELQAL